MATARLKTTALGETGMHITRVGFGAWAIGGGGWEFGWGAQDDEESVAAIHRALELGVNWIDTAAAYGFGHSEEIVGRALEEVPNVERPYVFTKAAFAELKNRGVVRHIGVSNFSIEQLRRAQQIAPVETLQPQYSLVVREAEAE